MSGRVFMGGALIRNVLYCGIGILIHYVVVRWKIAVHSFVRGRRSTVGLCSCALRLRRKQHVTQIVTFALFKLPFRRVRRRPLMCTRYPFDCSRYEQFDPIGLRREKRKGVEGDAWSVTRSLEKMVPRGTAKRPRKKTCQQNDRGARSIV